MEERVQAEMQRMHEAYQVMNEAQNSGDPEFMQAAEKQLMQQVNVMGQLGIDPQEAIAMIDEQNAQQQQQQAGMQMLGQAHNEGMRQGQMAGRQQGMEEGRQAEVIRRGGAVNAQPDVGVVTNASRDIVEGIMARNAQQQVPQG